MVSLVFFCGGQSSNPGPCIYYALSIPTEHEDIVSLVCYNLKATNIYIFSFNQNQNKKNHNS